ncbi:SPOR domain-containing protein [Qipengyuania nanhaisediminis]|uniref:SPOR domain-containing protein n=1 Tax=Qipengyuania nanhaisediminis TaxID=604088 RepID=UPI0038B3EF0D
MMIEAEYEEVEQTEGELDLSAEESLPWLEADEDDDNAGAIDTAQIVGFAAILLAVLALVVGAVWFYSNGSAGDDIVADGSVIEAPDGPIRERPEDPGGREFAGTGNVAPVVGEGGTREGVLDTDGGDAAGSGENGESGENAGSQAPAASAAGVGVQLAAYTSRARAEQGWNDLRRRTNKLDGVRYRIEQGTVDIGTVYRLQAVADTRAEADALCTALRSDGLDCQVKG